jgi:DNA-binding IclR family transcriptional regulator
MSRPETLHRVLAAVQAFTREHGRAPSLNELTNMTGLARSTVWYALNTLRRDYGYVRWEKRREGTLRVTERY